MIYQTLTVEEFRNMFYSSTRGNQFTYEALGAIYDYLDSSDEDITVDVIGICCDFSEDTLEEIKTQYDIESFEELQDHTWATRLDNGNILYVQH